MKLPSPKKLRLAAGVIVILVLALLIYLESIESSVGLVMIAAVLGALGLYEAKQR